VETQTLETRAAVLRGGDLPHDIVVDRPDRIDLDAVDLRRITAKRARGLNHLGGYWDKAKFHAGRAGACHKDTDGQELEAPDNSPSGQEGFRCAFSPGSGFDLVASLADPAAIYDRDRHQTVGDNRTVCQVLRRNPTFLQ
jgi:hypothetical protein